jgi:hypothetical protein
MNRDVTATDNLVTLISVVVTTFLASPTGYFAHTIVNLNTFFHSSLQDVHLLQATSFAPSSVVLNNIF